MSALQVTRRTETEIVEVNLAIVEHMENLTTPRRSYPLTIQPISVDITYTRIHPGGWEITWRVNGVRILKRGRKSTQGTHSLRWHDLSPEGWWGTQEGPEWIAEAVKANHPDSVNVSV